MYYSRWGPAGVGDRDPKRSYFAGSCATLGASVKLQDLTERLDTNNMDPAKRILSSLVSTSQRVHAIATQYANAKDVSQVRGHSLIRLEMELQTISASCGAILEILNLPLHSLGRQLDDRLIDWLSDDEPKRCLETLNEMQNMLQVKADRRARSFNGPTESSCPEDKAVMAAITLFHSRKALFHFLLAGDIW